MSSEDRIIIPDIKNLTVGSSVNSSIEYINVAESLNLKQSSSITFGKNVSLKGSKINYKLEKFDFTPGGSILSVVSILCRIIST